MSTNHRLADISYAMTMSEIRSGALFLFRRALR